MITAIGIGMVVLGWAVMRLVSVLSGYEENTGRYFAPIFAGAVCFITGWAILFVLFLAWISRVRWAP